MGLQGARCVFDRRKDILVIPVWTCIRGPLRRHGERICEGEMERDFCICVCVCVHASL